MSDAAASGASVLAYYDATAQAYVDRTWSLDMAAVMSRFSALLKPGARILDAGCGSGRDVVAFSKQGYAVDAFDGSAELAAIATQRTGHPVRHLSYREFQARDAYDGIWACSSLVHLSDADLADVLERFHTALQVGGLFFTCFKEGAGMRVDDAGRPFNDFTKERLRQTLRKAGFVPRVAWRTPQTVAAAGFWLNAIVAKV